MSNYCHIVILNSWLCYAEAQLTITFMTCIVTVMSSQETVMLSVIRLIYCDRTRALKVRGMPLQIITSALTAHTAALLLRYFLQRKIYNQAMCDKWLHCFWHLSYFWMYTSVFCMWWWNVMLITTSVFVDRVHLVLLAPEVLKVRAEQV